MNIKTLTIAFHKPYDTSTEEGRSNERTRRIALTALTSTILRALTIAVPLITLPITYKYLNEEVYGLWSAVTTFFGLFAFSDLGLGNGLQTMLSQANGKDDVLQCRKIISNTYIILLFVGIILSICFLAVFPFINWASLMNAESNETILLASSVVLVIILPKLLSIPIAIIQRTQLALQEGFRNDIWNIVGVFLSLISIVLIAWLDLGKITLLTCSSLIPLFIALMNMLFFFYVQRKDLKLSFKLFEYPIAKKLLALGVNFCILSVLITFGLSMDTFIVAKTCSLVDAGSYSILLKVSTIFSAVVTVLSSPLWGANGEALARGDVKWVKNNTRKMSYIMSTIALVLSTIGLLSARFIFDFWLGESFKFSYVAMIWLCFLQILLSFISPYFMVLNAYGKVKIQILIFLIYAPLSFLFKYLLSERYGIEMIPMVGSLLYLLLIVLWVYNITNKILNKNLQL